MNYEQSLLAIFKEYPRRVCRRKALQSIGWAIKRLQNGEGHYSEEKAVSLLIDAAREFALSPAGNRGVYTAHPTTWFNQSRYLDERSDWWNCTREELQTIRNAREANIGYRPL